MDDPLYREWISWNYARRLEIWDEFNRVTRKAGGRHCIWVGMMAGSQSWQSRVFRDDREIYRRAELIMLDHQRRFDAEGFQNNAETGMRLRSVGGWDKVIPESMAMYHLGEHNFRLAAKPVPEARLWVVEGFAGGVQPWWHHLGATQEDRRMFATAEPLWRWHEAHEAALIGRKPIATVGLVWSQRNMDFFGRDDAGALVEDPWNGFTQALVRARIPYVPVHIDDIERVSAELGLHVLILPTSPRCRTRRWKHSNYSWPAAATCWPRASPRSAMNMARSGAIWRSASCSACACRPNTPGAIRRAAPTSPEAGRRPIYAWPRMKETAMKP